MNEWTLSQISIGTRQSFNAAVTAEMMASFCEISGDLNPLHTDENYAREVGYRGAVVYGMLTASFYSTLVGMYLPGKLALFHSLECSFTHPVYIGDQLEISGEVTAVHEGFKQIEIKAQVKNQEKKIVSKAKIKAGVRER